MLLNCPECELPVSSKAQACPHCGYPMKEGGRPPQKRKSNKRKRLPNGFGQISEIKNRNLRKPFRAMVSAGKHPSGRPICKPLKPESYFPTYNDAYAALVEYNRNPYDLAPSMTVAELYERWSESHFKTLKNPSSAQPFAVAWAHCSPVRSMRAADIRARHIKGCIDEGTATVRGVARLPNAVVKTRIKSLFNLMFDYALEYELVDRNYARTFTLPEEVIKDAKTTKNEHIPFTDDEMRLLWENVDGKRLVDAVLIQCYSGWRPLELCLLEIENTDLGEWTFKGGMKTSAGADRKVPIHPKIRHLVKRRHDEAARMGSKYLFNVEGNSKDRSTALNYRRLLKGFVRIRDELKLDPAHRPHDGRKHFVTAAKRCGVDEYAIKYLVGHSISDITEKVYTKREFDWLRSEIEKIS